MVDFKDPKTIGIMLFYAALTFFVGPMVAEKLMADNENKYEIGFVLGFIVSIGLWMKFGKEMVN